MRKNLVATFCVLAAIALPFPALADVKAGVDAWERGDYPAAVNEWRPLAIKGDADAQFNLGQAYRFGRGVPADMKQAEDWYRQAAAQGHFQAEDNLGLIMFQNGDRQGAMPLIQHSADRGDPRAQYVLGTALFNGDIVERDWISAYALMTRASASGLARASESLAQMDKYIPLEQRQKGLALARDMEAKAGKPRLDLAAVEPDPAAGQTSVTSTTAAPKATAPEPTPVRKTVAPELPAPIKSVSAAAWRVQLGAFGESAKAKSAWGAIKTRVSGLGALQPSYAKAGAVTRLQAGPLGSKAEAERVCSAAKAVGQACFPVAP